MTLERVVAGLVERVEHRYFGKYRGLVVDNEDPAHLGRLKVRVPSVLGSDVVTGWATPCVPFGGAADQGFLFIPERGAGVWVEFEEGDLEFPVWVGTYWSRPNGESELPKSNETDGSEQSDVQAPPTRKIIKTKKGHTIQLEDADGAEIVLIREGSQGHLVTMDKDGIKVTDGSGNSAELTPDGIKLTDKSKNTLEMTSDGIKLTDTKKNTIDLTKSAFTLTAKVPFKIDAAGQTVTVVGSAIDLQKG